MTTDKPKNKTVAKGPLIIASAALLAFLGMWEGNAQYIVYADKLAGGIPTVCKGLTRHVTNTPIIVGEKWSAAKCEAEEIRVVTALQAELLECFSIPPPQSVFDAATSHAWNLGVNNTCKSSAMARFRVGDWPLGCRRLMMADDGRLIWAYVRVGTEFKFVKGLANRREAEYKACIEGAYK
jgi:lysozyme